MRRICHGSFELRAAKRLPGGRFVRMMLLALLILAAGCTDDRTDYPETAVIKNPGPEHFLDRADADIFLLGGVVYSNAEQIDWVKEREYALGELAGEIVKQAQSADEFENGTANKLPVGTKIYETDAGFCVAVVNGKEIPYLKMVEG
jgi:hypothetical protein